MTYTELVQEFLAAVELVRLEAYAATGYEWMVVPGTGAYRSIKVQHGLFIQAHDGLDNDHDGAVDESDEKVTAADGGQSPHNFDLARDIVPLSKPGVIWWQAPEALWHSMGAIAEKHGLVWGGHFKSLYDAPHIEHPRWREQQALWKAGKLALA